VDEQPASGLPSIFDDGDVYDLVGKDVPYGLDFYVALAREASGPVLDIACGTGRILLPCLQAGVDIEGLDLFEPRMYDTRSFDRVAQVFHSQNDIELLAADGSVQTVHRSEDSSRYIYKHEMALLLRVAGFARWEICGDFDRRPLMRENEAMVVTAWDA